MISKAKRYFSFFGMMASSSDMKMAKLYSQIGTLDRVVDNIINLLLIPIILQPITKTIKIK